MNNETSSLDITSDIPVTSGIHVDIRSDALDLLKCHHFLNLPEAGGQVVFVGTVRRFTDTGNTGYCNGENLGNLNPQKGRGVIETIALDYDAYRPLAIAAMTDLVNEAKQRFELNRVLMEHRIGRVDIGQAAILIGTCSQHRKNAFAGTQFLIDQVKQRIPVWKREILADGSSYWVHPKPSQ